MIQNVSSVRQWKSGTYAEAIPGHDQKLVDYPQ